MKQTVWYLLLVACVFSMSGCVHAPPAGVTRGVVEIKNTRVRDGDSPGQILLWTNTLTGVVIGEHMVLTVAHTFEDEPDPDHPITIDGRMLEYTIIADSWDGLRGERVVGDKVVKADEIPEDYILLKTTESFSDYARLVPLEHGRIGDLRDLYLVTRRSETGEVEAILAKRMRYGNDREYITVELPARAHEGFYLSGSPLIGTYEDGTLVLAGILKGHGDISFKIDGKPSDLVDQFFILPAYRIPFDVIDEN